MSSPKKMSELLLDLGPSAERWTRTELLDHALRTTLLLMEADATVVTIASARGEERLMLHDGATALAALRLPAEGSEALRLLAQGCEPLVLATISEDARVAASDGCPGVELGPVIFTPIKRHGLAPAYLAAYRKGGRARFTTSQTHMMTLLGVCVANALENLRLVSGAKRLRVSDEVTEVYNHRFFKTALGRELRRASRYALPLSLVAIDVDGFGNLGGDGVDPGALLKELATELAQQVRAFDILARQKGGRFVLVLPQTDGDGAVEVAERMREAVEQRAFSVAPAGAITLSLGVASFPNDGSVADDLVAASDRALDQARQQGSNRVATAKRRAA